MDNSDPLIQIRVSKDMYKKIQKLAEADDRKVAPWCRLVIMGYLDKVKS